VTYQFLSLLPASESLASRGPRLQETAPQRQAAIYGSDMTVNVEVEEASQKLLVNFVDDGRLVLLQGECKRMKLWLSNAGTQSIGDVWMVAGTEDEIWVDFRSNSSISSVKQSWTEILHSDNSILPRRPYRVPLDNSLAPGDNVEFSVILHADRVSEGDLSLLFVFREAPGQSFHSARVTRYYEVTPIFEVSANSQPSRSMENLFLLNLELDNISSSSTVQLTQITTLSPLWECTPVVDDIL
jgi:trafficking protein particle complex subunit 8